MKSDKQFSPTPSGGEVLLYEAPDGQVRVDVRLEQETVWLTQRQMGDLFDTSIDNVGLHLKNIFADAELDETATTEDFSAVQSEGRRQVRRNVKHYNLDATNSVGYRVKLAVFFARATCAAWDGFLGRFRKSVAAPIFEGRRKSLMRWQLLRIS